MARNHILKIGLNVTVNIVLFIIYIFLFGIQSISKYFDNGVTIITHEVKPLNMIPPGKFTKKYILYDIGLKQTISVQFFQHFLYFPQI